jgi:hypothetical protein
MEAMAPRAGDVQNIFGTKPTGPREADDVLTQAIPGVSAAAIYFEVKQRLLHGEAEYGLTLTLDDETRSGKVSKAGASLSFEIEDGDAKITVERYPFFLTNNYVNAQLREYLEDIAQGLAANLPPAARSRGWLPEDP